MKHLLVIAGSTQLITALNALDEIIIKNDEIHVIIKELSVEDKQYSEFENYIKILINYFRHDYNLKIIHEINDIYDKIFVPTYWQPHVRKIIKDYPNDKVVIFGDGVGIVISKFYFDNQRLKFFRKIKYFIEFTFKYNHLKFILPDESFCLGFEKPKNILTAKKINFLKKLNSILYLEKLEYLNFLKNKKISIFFGVNLSESSRITLTNENELILDFLDNKLKNTEILIYKPHPRDSEKKTSNLTKIIKKNFNIKIFVLEDNQYVPAELIILKLINLKCKFENLFCFSTLAISLKWLFDFNPNFGFGSKRINKFFNNKFKKNMIIMENNMNKILKKK